MRKKPLHSQTVVPWIVSIGISTFALLLSGNSIVEAQALPTKHWDLRDEFKSYIHESWSSEQGLPQDIVTALAKTPDGYIWIGTQSGLVRFNGVTFRKQDRYNTPAMKSDFIRRLAVADDSTLWIGTDQGGVLSMRRDKISASSPSDSGSVEGTRAVVAGKNGIIWVTVPGSGVWKRVDGRWQRVQAGRPLTSTWAAIEDVDGSHWLGEDGALVHLTDTSVTWIGAAQGMPKAQVFWLLQDSRGAIIIGTRQHGIYMFSRGRIGPLSGCGALAKATVTSLCSDGAGGTWIGTLDKGLYYYDGRTTRECFSTEGRRFLQVSSLLSDNEGSLWIGTRGDGIHRLRKSVVQYAKVSEPGVSSEIWSVLMSGNTAWIGTRSSGIRRFIGTSIERPPMPEKLSAMTIGAFLEEPDGALWIGGEFGVFRKRGNVFDEMKMPDGKSFVNPFAMVHDGQGTVWIGGQGLYRFAEGKMSGIDGLPSGISINCLLQDSKGRLWIGSDANGVGLFAGGRAVFYSTDSGLVSNTILCLFEDSEGGICAGTQGGGLSRFKNGRWGSVTEKEGLLDGYVNTMIRSDDSSIWMSTNRGLFGSSERAIIEVAEGRRTSLDGISIESRDGLESTEFGGGLQNCSAKTSDGTLWFVSLKGLVGYNPRRTLNRTPPPPVNIESIEVDGQPLGVQDGIRLGPGLQMLRFEYVGLNYTVPSSTRYKYFLEGYDNEWVGARTRREATYTNLPPGEYTFHVTAACKESEWNNQEASIRILILPSFWQTDIFKVICLLVIIALIYIIYRARVWQMLKTEEKLRLRIDEAVASIKVLNGLIPICANCKKIRDDKGFWNDVAKYLTEHSDAKMSHGICPDCADELYGPAMKRIREKKDGERFP